MRSRVTVARLLVLPQRNEARMPQMIVRGPFDELELPDDLKAAAEQESRAARVVKMTSRQTLEVPHPGMVDRAATTVL